jgi:hypothetical protein
MKQSPVDREARMAKGKAKAGWGKRPKARRRTAAEACLDSFLPGAMAPPPKGTQTRGLRGAVDEALNAGKKDYLDFIQARLVEEAPRLAACLTDIWIREGSIPPQAGSWKFLNLPGAYLGQALWQHVAGQMKSWISNAENDFFADLWRLCAPGASAPVSRERKALADWLEKRAAAEGPPQRGEKRPRTPGERTLLDEKKAERALREKARWAEGLDAPAEAALAAFQALNLNAIQARAELRAAAWSAARRGARAPATPAETLARALWARTTGKRGAPTWKNIPIMLHPRMCSLAEAPKKAADDAPGAPQGEPARAAGARGRQGKKGAKTPPRKKAGWHLLLRLPKREAWPKRKEVVQDWRQAIVDAPTGQETKAQREERARRQEEENARAAGAGEEPKVFASPFKGRAPSVEIEVMALPVFFGEAFERHPGKLAESFALLPPRADVRGRGHWQARAFMKLDAAALHELGGRKAPRRGAGAVGIDAGLSAAMTTSVGCPEGTDARVARGASPKQKHKEDPEAGLAPSLADLLAGWGRSLKPLADEAAAIAAALQKAGRKKLAAELEWAQAMGRLEAWAKHGIEGALRAWVRQTRPTAVCVEALDLRGSRRGADGNRLLQWMGHGIAKAWLVANAPVHGFEVWEENAAFTSLQCSCGRVDKESRDGKLFFCRRCERRADADHNAALRLRERFLLAKWLLALGEAGLAALGLGKAPIERWMRPWRVLEALEAREAFLGDEARVRAAKAAGLLPAAVERIARQRAKALREAARRGKERDQQETGAVSGPRSQTSGVGRGIGRGQPRSSALA